MSLPQTVFKAPFDQFVKDQIELREQVYARGSREPRDMQDITYLNSRTGWVRLMSCVDIENIEQQLQPAGSDARLYNLPGVISDVEASIRDLAQGSKQELAYKFILSNGVQPANGKSVRDGLKFTPSLEPLLDNSNFKDNGKFKHWTNNSYGLGASVQGIKPMPGIISADVTDFNNGALREAKVKIKAWDIEQLQILELLYMRLGFTMYLEWGHSIYASGKPSPGDTPVNTYKIKSITEDGDPSLRSVIFPTPPNRPLTFDEILQKIQKQREKFEGNYDGFLGRVTNFNWTYNQGNESYDIDLTMITVGSVIESLNMNTQYDVRQASYQSNPEFTGSLEERYYYEGQKTNLGNFLWLGRTATLPNNRRLGVVEGLGTIPERTFYDDVNLGYGSVLYLDQITSSSIFGTSHFLERPLLSGYIPGTFYTLEHTYAQNIHVVHDDDYETEYITYIRFGDLLQWLDRHNNEIIDEQGRESTIINIHYDRESLINTMYVFTPYLFSADPSICVIQNKFEVQVTRTNTSLFGDYVYYGIVDPFYIPEKGNYGRTMNIALNIAFLMQCIDSSINEYQNGMVSVFDFLTKVCNGINESLGHVCHLFPWLDVETNTLFIMNEYDNNDSLRKESVQLTRLSTSGYIGQGPGDEEGRAYRSITGTVKDLKLKTGLSKDVQNTIAIGAAAQGVSLGQEAVSFLSWHKGLKDRIIPQLAQKRSQSENQQEEVRLDKEKERLERLIDNLSEIAYTMSTVNVVMFATDSDQENVVPAYVCKRLHCFDKDLFTQAKTLLKDYIHIGTAYVAKEQETATPYNGFLPLNFTLTMDGLSGMKIYQRFYLDARMVPPRYPVLFDTVVKGITHTIQNNTWDTTVETFATYRSIVDTRGYFGFVNNPFDVVLRKKDPEVKVSLKIHSPNITPRTVVVINPNPVQTTEQQKQNLQTILNELKQRGFTKEEAVGIAGNMRRESGFNPTRVQDGGGGGYGLVQWTPFAISGANAYDTKYDYTAQVYRFSNTYNKAATYRESKFTTAGRQIFTTHTPIYVLFNATRYKLGGQFAYNTIKGQIQFLTDELAGNLKLFIGSEFPYSTEPGYKDGLKWRTIKAKAVTAAGANFGLDYSLAIGKYFLELFENSKDKLGRDAVLTKQYVEQIYQDLSNGTLRW